MCIRDSSLSLSLPLSLPLPLSLSPSLSLSLSGGELVFTVHGGRSLESDVGKFQTLAIFSGILWLEAMPVSSQQHRAAAVGRFVSLSMQFTAERARKAAALGIRTLTVPLKIGASDCAGAICNRTTGSG